MVTRETLLSEIDDFLSRSGMKASTFGKRVVNDGKLVNRLREGGSVSIETAAKICDFVREEPQDASEAAQ